MKTRRRDKGEKDMKVKLCSLFGVMGGMIAAALGGWDTALQTLIIFMVADYATGVAVAGIFHKSKKTETGRLKSIAGAKGLAKKGMILLAVLIAYRLDLTAGTTYIRDMVILAFVANEALSIIENAGLMGVPMPAVITKAVDMLQQDKDNKKQA